MKDLSMTYHRKITYALLPLFIPAPSIAAPFCVQAQAIPAECFYYDAVQCRKRAHELNGLCVANPGELVITPGGTGKYCLVLSSRHTQCVYADRTTCENDAVPASGVCIERAPQDIQDDPYRFDPNRKY
jgi:hypothetical protein